MRTGGDGRYVVRVRYWPKAPRPMSIDHAAYRQVLGHYPTGVCAITSVLGGRPIGMVVGSFTSASLDPPLVGFLPDRKSNSWAEIRSSGRFCVNVLSHDQVAICKALATKGAAHKFHELRYQLSGSGLPVFPEACAWIDCKLHAVHEAGDHDIALGAVLSLHAEPDRQPMLFYRGGYKRLYE